MNFFENKASFAINIQILNPHKAAYVVFKPYIRIVSKDEDLIKLVENVIRFENTSIREWDRKKKNLQTLNNINVQDFKDIEKITDFLNSNSRHVISRERLSVFKNFEQALKIILEKGHVHKEPKDFFEQLIELKLQINSGRGGVDKNRYSKSEWMNRIEKNFKKISG